MQSKILTIITNMTVLNKALLTLKVSLLNRKGPPHLHLPHIKLIK